MINRRGVGLLNILQISSVNVSRLAYSVKGDVFEAFGLTGCVCVCVCLHKAALAGHCCS